MLDCGPRWQRASKVALRHGKMVPTTIESREEGREGDAQDQVQQDGGKYQNKRELDLQEVYIGSWRLMYSRHGYVSSPMTAIHRRSEPSGNLACPHHPAPQKSCSQ